METHELKIVSRVLGVMHDVDELDFNHPDLKFVLDKHALAGSALIEYDLNKNPVAHLPNTVVHIAHLIEQHLQATDNASPWGLINEKLLILKLQDHLFSHCGKLLLFSVEYIAENLLTLFPGAQITTAERRVLLQSLSGVSLRKAADIDNVSYETKKSQLKNVFQKTHFNNQQALSNFLITHFTLELASRISRKQANAESDEMYFHYIDTYMGSYVRASVVQESASKRFRVIELGDPAGTPVVCVHHLGLINFTEAEIECIRRNRIRLICPLRHGALGPSDPRITNQEYVDHAIAGIDLAVSLSGQQNAIVLSLLSGCMYAMNYIERHPKKVNQLIMLGASYQSVQQNSVTSSFKQHLHDLANEHGNMLELTVSTLLESVDQVHKLKNVVKVSNNNGDADNQTIDELFADKQQVKAMQHRLKHSPLSIVQDLKTQATKNWSNFQGISQHTNMHFIHGSADSLIPIDKIKQLVGQLPGVQLHVVEGAGNWIFGRYTSQTASIVRSIIDNDPSSDHSMQ